METRGIQAGERGGWSWSPGYLTLIAKEVSLDSRAAQIGGAQHMLLLDYGFTLMKVTEDTAAYQRQPEGHQVTLDALGHWWIKPEGGTEIRGIGFVDLEAVLSPDARRF